MANIVSRADAEAIIREQVVSTIFQDAPLHFPQNGAFDANVAQLIVGDFSQAVYSIRQDVTLIPNA